MKSMKAAAGERITDFWREAGKWSFATFGSPEERDAEGPLKHLAREVLIEFLGIPRQDVLDLLERSGEAQAKVLDDPEEYADLFLLVTDAARRSGMTLIQLLQHSQKKLAINKKRKWQKPTKANDAVEHVR